MVKITISDNSQRGASKGSSKNPFFYSLRQKITSFKNSLRDFLFSRRSKKSLVANTYVGVISLLLLVFMFFGSQTLATLGYLKNSTTTQNLFFKEVKPANSNDVFFNPNKTFALETPDFKIIQGNFIYGISTPRVLTAQTLGDMFGGDKERKEIESYIVQNGDTAESVAQSFGLTTNTILWANSLAKGEALKAGQSLAILPFDGVAHVVKEGDTIDKIAQMYKAKKEDIIVDNNLANEGDVFIGDIFLVRGGVMTTKPAPVVQTPLAGTSWIYPLLRFKVTQWLHFFNAVDISSLDGCGSSVYAVAAGVVQRAGYDRIGGNRVTILHPNGVVTYYGHLRTILVVPGQKVVTGTRIGLEGESGEATGCHVHFQVMGAANYMAQKFGLGQMVDVTKR